MNSEREFFIKTRAGVLTQQALRLSFSKKLWLELSRSAL